MRRLSVLWVLYFVQGLPYGFQILALPVYLRGEGVSLTGIGLASALGLPWLLKFLWSPLVDRYRHGPLGARRSWILPLQGGLAATCFLAATLSATDGLTELLLLVLAMNFCAATLDVAVDGLAVDLLRPEELGYGNIAQVVGYKIGILTGGGLLVWASQWVGWKGLFLAMGALVLIAGIRVLAFRETPPPSALDAPRLGAILRALGTSLRAPGGLWLLLVVLTYKTGESFADAMFKPFLVDAGFEQAQIGLWVGTWGMVFSIAGSVLGGVVASRLDPLRAILWAALFRILPLAGQWLLAVVGTSAEAVIVVTCGEQFFGGALTTAMFAYMMSRVDKRIGATHYTLLASLEVVGKMVASSTSGLLADATSYAFLFAVATLLSVLFLGLVLAVRRPLLRPPG
ncbi:MAG: MFS transporter [Acidobacteriota bacterium]